MAKPGKGGGGLLSCLLSSSQSIFFCAKQTPTYTKAFCEVEKKAAETEERKTLRSEYSECFTDHFMFRQFQHPIYFYHTDVLYTMTIQSHS